MRCGWCAVLPAGVSAVFPRALQYPSVGDLDTDSFILESGGAQCEGERRKEKTDRWRSANVVLVDRVFVT